MQKKIVPITVIIVNYKTPTLTRRALLALFNSSVQPAEVVLVDNNSQDNTMAMVQQEFPQVQIIANSENLGFAKANNQAIRQFSTQPYVWLLNSDTETGQKSLEELFNFMTIHPKVAVLGPQLMYPSRELQSVGGYFPSASNVFMYLIPFTVFLPKFIRRKLKSLVIYPQALSKKGREIEYVTGAALFLRKEALDQVGLLCEDYFMYFEETDLCLRLKQAGWDIKVIDTDPVMHVYGGSFKTKYDPKRLKIFLASLTFFVKKNCVGFKKIIILAEIIILGSVSLLLKRFKSFI
ncbi:MAG: Glycosyl transferase family 2 [Candidatus Magasanikbacteria bacterium GW2011_GWA2_40_10]|uniref:Glycosyl transferase family 2 n=1 Tax=Candidatus Magasanikbacteria bacterium GW2011_GWA2_40_10 TaxID=1619037 RepID=A0A0G0Q341_9BACT|nr:MAG: Glycosyl transferase family 2 [Candidatus Magasanikbacteria bacterium GW2011_GWA2_40_10]